MTAKLPAAALGVGAVRGVGDLLLPQFSPQVRAGDETEPSS